MDLEVRHLQLVQAVAESGSLTRAGAVLHLTQSALSHQLKDIESRLGTPLFLRLPKRVALSELGKRLAAPVTEAFQRLEAAFAATRETNEGVLSVTAIQSFATNWLVPRLGTFQLAHPDIAVRLAASGRMVDFAREEFDLGIRGGQGRWPGLKAHRLIPIDFTPMCSPEFIARRGRPT